MASKEWIKEVEELIKLNKSLLEEHGPDDALEFDLQYLEGYLEIIKKEVEA